MLTLFWCELREAHYNFRMASNMIAIDELSVNEDGADIAAELQEDILKLQRQYRLLREDRKAYASETGQILKWQHQIIADLMKEEDELLTDMKLVTQPSNRFADKKLAENLRTLIESEDTMKLAIRNENSKLCSTEDSVRKQMQNIGKLSKVIGSNLAEEEKYIKTQRSIRMLERKIEHSVQRFDNTLARNAKYRRTIKLITLDRKRFADLNKKLEGIHKRGTKEKMKLIQSSQSLFTSREDAEHKMSLLKEKAERDRASFNAELKDLLRIIDNDKRLREFMQTKVKGLGDIYDHIIQANREKKAVNNQKTLQSEIKYYDGIFRRLMEVSGLHDINEMVTRYVTVEDQNFSILNYINDQELQRKELQDAIEFLKVDTERIRKLNTVESMKRKKILAEVEEQFDKISQLRESNNTREKRAHILFDKVKKTIWNLHKRIHNTAIGSSGMMNTSEITEENLVQFLGVIENKAIEMLQIKLVIAIDTNDEQEINMLHSVWAGHRGKLAKGYDSTSEYSRGHEQPVIIQNASETCLKLPE